MAFPTGWSNKRKLTIDNTKVSGSSNLTDFPVLVSDGNFGADVYTNATIYDTHSVDLESGSSQHAAITNASQTGLNMGAGDHTVEAWVKLESDTGADMTIAAKGRGGAGGKRYYLYVNAQKAIFSLDDDTTLKAVTGATTLTLGVWYHIAGVRDGNNLRIYVNGKEDQTATDITGYGDIDDVGDFTIGALKTTTPSTGNYFDGLISEVRVWSDARTAAEIKTNYHYAVNGNETNLVGNWRLNNDYLDQTSNNNDLTSSGSPVFSTTTPNLFPKDLRFSSDVDGTTELPFEIVAWDNGGSTAEVWVKVPTVDFDADTDFYVWYNAPTEAPYAATDTYGGQAVWTNYNLVSHLQGGVVDSKADLTITDNGSVDATGKIKQGRDLDGSADYLSHSPSGMAHVASTNDFTIHAWIARGTTNTADQIFMGRLSSGNGQGLDFFIDPGGADDKIQVRLTADDGTQASSNSTTGITDTSFHHIILIHDGGANTYTLVIDGAVDATIDGYAPGKSFSGITSNTDWGAFGTWAFTQWFDGIFDEIRIRNGEVTTDWAITEYNNQNSPSTFISESAVGGAEAGTGIMTTNTNYWGAI